MSVYMHMYLFFVQERQEREEREEEERRAGRKEESKADENKTSSSSKKAKKAKKRKNKTGGMAWHSLGWGAPLGGDVRTGFVVGVPVY